MGKEIEHKYLVTDDSYKAMAVETRCIEQGYISRTVNGTVRVRLIGERARLTIKGRTVGDTRSEYEYDIDIMIEAKAKDEALFKLVRELKYKTNYKFIDDTTFII